MLRENLINIYEASFRENHTLPALTDYFKQESFTYLEMGAEIAKLHLLFDEAGIRQGDRIALRGANGTGKTSLLRLLCGEDVPHTGTVERSSRLQISYVRQDPSGLRGDLGAYAARYGLDESLFKAILRKLDFARVQFEKDMADFSAGQKKKVLLAGSLCEPSHLLVWDEPLNYVDVLSRMQIEDLLLEFQPTIVFVEHDRVFCDHVATKAVML